MSEPERPPQVIVLGPPGSGKSTIAALLAERLGAAELDLGSRLRELGAATAGGELVPDELADRVVHDELAGLPPNRGFVLSGYPRTPGQAGALRGTLEELGRLQARPTAVHLDVPRDELRRRLGRRRDAEHRPDDTGDTMDRRLADDARRAPAVLDALTGWADVVPVDGSRPPDEVAARILAELG